MQWFVKELKSRKREVQIWLVADGAYATRPFLIPLLKEDVVVVSRLRKDAHLRDLPPARDPDQRKPRGRPRIYGHQRISLAKRAGQPRGWQSITFNCRGEEVTREYKTFQATSCLVSGEIRVVLMRDGKEWVSATSTAVLIDRSPIGSPISRSRTIMGCGSGLRTGTNRDTWMLCNFPDPAAYRADFVNRIGQPERVQESLWYLAAQRDEAGSRRYCVTLILDNLDQQDKPTHRDVLRLTLRWLGQRVNRAPPSDAIGQEEINLWKVIVPLRPETFRSLYSDVQPIHAQDVIALSVVDTAALRQLAPRP